MSHRTGESSSAVLSLYQDYYSLLKSLGESLRGKFVNEITDNIYIYIYIYIYIHAYINFINIHCSYITKQISYFNLV